VNVAADAKIPTVPEKIEEHIKEIRRKYSVILERIQAYDKVLDDFAKITSELENHKQSLTDLKVSTNDSFNKQNLDIRSLRAKISELCQFDSKAHDSLEAHKASYRQCVDGLTEGQIHGQRELDSLKLQHKNSISEQDRVRDLTISHSVALSQLIESNAQHAKKIDALSKEHASLKEIINASISEVKSNIDKISSSVQEMPQFNEWATKIYIKVCNEINEKTKSFYTQLDQRSQQLREQLASDPYTAESVKTILKKEMDDLSLDGKNAFIKSTNNTQQIQLLEKKIENINLILKKYELNK
jgi:hypothetical protein